MRSPWAVFGRGGPWHSVPMTGMHSWKTAAALLFAMTLSACGDDDGSTDAGAGDAPFDVGARDDAPVIDAGVDAPSADPVVQLPRTAIEADELAVLVNDMDPQSVALGEAYVAMRGVPEANVVHLSFEVTGAVMDEATFDTQYAAVQAALPDTVQAQLITWTTPYRVECMSVTSAFALGFDRIHCNTTGEGCGPTAAIRYFDTDSTHPFTDFEIRPAMMLAATSVDSGTALIARGLEADGTHPPGHGWLVRTTDVARSVRHPQFRGVDEGFDVEGGLSFDVIDNSDGSGTNLVTDETDVLFYFTGLTRVTDLETNTYRPGAIADHLTSFGGRVPDAGGQMSVVVWLEGGVTGSFGTTVEPCNYTTKFPNVGVVVPQYFRGATLIEAYWKSVRTPGEGLFVGEPLARPFGEQTLAFEGDEIVIETNAFGRDDGWVFESGDTADGPWTEVQSGTVAEWSRQTFRLPNTGAPNYRLRRPD